LLDGSAGFLHAGCLLTGRLAHALCSGRNLLTGRCDIGSSAINFANDLRKFGDGIVNGVLKIFELPLVIAIDGFGEVALLHVFEYGNRFVEGEDDAVQYLVDTCHQLAEITLVFGYIGTGIEPTFGSGFDQVIGVGQQRFDGVGHAFHGGQQLAGFIGAGDLNAGGQVACGNLFGGIHGYVQR